jgi:hypothetical protein
VDPRCHTQSYPPPFPPPCYCWPAPLLSPSHPRSRIRPAHHRSNARAGIARRQGRIDRPAAPPARRHAKLPEAPSSPWAPPPWEHLRRGLRRRPPRPTSPPDHGLCRRPLPTGSRAPPPTSPPHLATESREAPHGLRRDLHRVQAFSSIGRRRALRRTWLLSPAQSPAGRPGWLGRRLLALSLPRFGLATQRSGGGAGAAGGGDCL